MSTTVNTIPMTVDEKIQTRRELRKAVELATSLFSEMYFGLPDDPKWTNPKLSWRYLEKGSYTPKKNNKDMDVVRAIFVEEESDTGRYEVHEDIPVHRMFDDYGRSSHLTGLFFSVSANKRKVLRIRGNKLILELEQESTNGV